MKYPTAVAALALFVAGAAGAQDKGMALPKPGPITAPAGTYKVDPNHASLQWKLLHFGLAPYHARFTKFDAQLQLDPAKLANSAITVTIDANSVETDYPGDFQATHKDSPYKSFDERVAKEFLKSEATPTITFKSTRVEPRGKDKARVTGDLTLGGQTHPVTLDVAVVGSIAAHPFTKRGAVGFSATTTFKRSQWGLGAGVPMVGDDVTLTFDGEFQQAAPNEPAPKSEN